MIAPPIDAHEQDFRRMLEELVPLMRDQLPLFASNHGFASAMLSAAASAMVLTLARYGTLSDEDAAALVHGAVTEVYQAGVKALGN